MGASPQTPTAAGRTLPSLPIREAGGTPNGRGSSVGCCSLAALAAKKGEALLLHLAFAMGVVQPVEQGEEDM